MGPRARRQGPPSPASHSIPCTLPGSWEAAETSRTKSPSSSRGGEHLREGKGRERSPPLLPNAGGPPTPGPTPRSSRGHREDPQPRRLQGPGTPSPGGSSVPVPSCPGAPGFPRYPCPRPGGSPVPVPTFPGVPAVPVPLGSRHGYTEDPPPPRLQGPGASPPRRLQSPGAASPRQLRASRTTCAPPPPAAPGARCPRGPGAHPVRMVPARCRQRSPAQRGSARSGGIGTARGAGRLREGQGLREVMERDNSVSFWGWGHWGRSPPFLMGKGEFISPESTILRGTEESRDRSSCVGKPLPSPCSRHPPSVGTADLLLPSACLIFGVCLCFPGFGGRCGSLGGVCAAWVADFRVQILVFSRVPVLFSAVPSI